MSSKASGKIAGYRYYFGVHFILGIGPFDKLKWILVDKKLAYWAETLGGRLNVINAPELFGGDNREGGITGTFDVDMGYLDQTQNDYLNKVITPGTNDISAYRGYVSVILRQCYMGLHYYLKPWSFLCTRIYKSTYGIAQWQSAIAEPIPGCMNPIHIIRELLTSPVFGLNEPIGRINEDNFFAAATTAYNEAIGVSFYWTADTTVEEFIKVVLNHVDGSLYVNPANGKYEIKLIRDDYDISTLLHLTETQIKEINDYKHQTIDMLSNQVNLKYWNISTLLNDGVQVNNPGLAQRQGAIIPVDYTYEGITDPTLALKIANRLLRQVSSDIPTMSIVCDRTAEALQVGFPLKITWPDLYLTEYVVRVLDIDLGTLKDNKITLKVAKDVFTVPTFGDSIPSASGWVDPVSAPSPVSQRIVQELPYYMYAIHKGDAAAQAIPTNYGFIVCCGKSPTGDAFSAIIEADGGAGYKTNSSMNFCPYAILSSSIDKVATSLSINNIFDWNLVEVGMFLQIGTEIMGISAVSDTTLTVQRGILDTIPVAHANGEHIFVWEGYFGTPETEYVLSEVVSVKLLTVTGHGTLAITDAPADTVTMVDRFHKPYPPGNFKINSVAFPTSASGNLVVTWSHRNRLTETSNFVGQTAGDVTPEGGTTYNCRLYDGGTLKSSVTGITGTTTTFTSPGAMTVPRIELESVRDGLVSFQHYNHSFTYTP